VILISSLRRLAGPATLTLLACALAACGGGGSSNSSGTSTAATTTTPSTTTTPPATTTTPSTTTTPPTTTTPSTTTTTPSTTTTTTPNSVVATPSSAQQIQAVVGGSTTTTVAFTTSDGNAASNLRVTNLSLPAGWTTTTPSFACAQLGSGNGCVLNLRYAPTSVASGTVTINFSYADSTGAARTGSTSFKFASTAQDNNAVAAVSPVSPVSTAATGTGLPVTVTFTTDDDQPASGLHITSPATLPTYWGGNLGTTCNSFATGNGCQLALTYAPTAINSGTLTIGYAYTSGSGVAKTGSTTISYLSTTHDTVSGAVAPTGQIATALTGTQPVTVTFATDDAKTASALTIISGISALPAGWTGPPTFGCSTVPATGGTGCQLTLQFAPTVAGSGTLALGYGYTDNAGSAQTGTVNITYDGTTNNNVASLISPGGTVTTSVNTPSTVTVTLNTDDANSATGLTIAGADGLATLPTGWTGPASVSCPTVSHTGSTCLLTLTFNPASVVSGTVPALTYHYVSDTGISKTGTTAAIPYATVTGHVYIADGGNNGTVTTGGNQIVRCALLPSGALSTCTTALSVANLDPRDVVLNGNYAYVSERTTSGQIDVCTINADGTLSPCTATGTGFSANHGIAINGSYLYVANTGGFVSVCAISPTNGTLSNCTPTAPYAAGGSFEDVPSPAAIAFANGYAFIADEQWDGGTNNYGSIIACTVEVNGTLDNCLYFATGASSTGGNLPHNNPDVLVVQGTNLFIGFPGGLAVCSITTISSVSAACNTVGPTGDAHGLGFANNFAYIGEHDPSNNPGDTVPTIWICPMSGTQIGTGTAGGTYAQMGCTAATGTTVVSPEMLTFF
jgi:LVIVD repeat-containing protein